MSNWNQYLKLWQQKRNELHISADMDTDWSDMHQLLDKHMPLNAQPFDGGNAGNTGKGGLGTGAKLLNLAKFKLLYVVAGLIIGSGITYLAIHHINQKAAKVHKTNKARIDKDSTLSQNAPKNGNMIHAGDNTTNDLKNNQAPPSDVDSSAKSTAGYGVGINKPANNAIKSNVGTLSPATNRSASSANTDGQVSNNIRKRNQNALRASNGRQTALPSAGNSQIDNAGGLNNEAKNNHQDRNKLTIYVTPPPSALTWDEIATNTDSRANAGNVFNKSLSSLKLGAGFNNQLAIADRDLLNSKISANKKIKAAKATKTPGLHSDRNLDWGILAGVDGLGSWTSKSQNHNFYGSLPADIYFGLFANYNLNDRWAIGLQSRFLVPHAVSGSYSYVSSSETIQVSDARKLYTIDVPVHVIYKPIAGMSLKAGPLLSIRAKTADGDFPNAGNDSTGTKSPVTQALNATGFANKVQVGASGGIGFSYKSVWFDATYNYYSKGQKISSSLGGYSADINSLQLTIGIKLNKRKK